MEIIEQYCREIAAHRGVNPDEPVTIGNPDGTTEYFPVAWEGYRPLAEKLLALHDAPSA